jgi:hypothetical protein
MNEDEWQKYDKKRPEYFLLSPQHDPHIKKGGH